jgi:WD40 repeat protein
MSATLKHTYGALPSTTRGKPIHIGGDPKGKNFLYTCGQAVFIRDLKNPLNTEMYGEHQHQTTVARYAPSGFYIASGDVSGTIRIWDTTQVEHILKIELKMLGGPILDLQWSDDSKRIVCVGEGKEKFGSVFMFDSGSSVGEISAHSKPVASCDFKQTRPYRIVTAGEDMLVNYFEGPPFKFKKSIKDHTRFVNCVRFSPDGERFLSVGLDKVGLFFDGKTGEPIGKLSATNGHTGGIYSCSWSADSKRVLTASADKTCKIWDAASGECQVTFTFGDQLEDQQLGCLWQGDELLSINLGGDINYLDQANPSKPKRVLKGHNKFITALTHDRKTNTLYTASYDAAIIGWDVATGETSAFSGKGHTNQVGRLKLQGGNLVSAAMDDTVRITNLANKSYTGEVAKFDTAPADIAVGVQDNTLVIAVVTDAIIVLRNGQVAHKLVTKYQPSAVALSNDEKTVAVGGKDNNIHLYTLSGNNLTEGKVLNGHRGALSSLTYSPDGKFLASADLNRDIFVWDLASQSIKISGWQFHSARVNSLSWTDDSQHLASGALDGAIYVWSVQDPLKRVTVKNAHFNGVNSVLWLDANTLASAGQDCTAKTWTVKFH